VEKTEAEKHLDALIEERRQKGRDTYGKGLTHTDDYDWNEMAMEEALDMIQYLAAENLRLRTESRALNLAEYQVLASVTANKALTSKERMTIACLGLTGEAGELVDMWKKVVGHGHEQDTDKLAKEAGDVLWYLAEICSALGISLSAVARNNIDKLKRRYPEGFSTQASKARVDVKTE
jgi:NTP pyrophosphatase (non-canonical NTP hydrolase)